MNAGTLVVNGSIASPLALTIAGSAKLAGNGSIASPVTVTGTLAPGSPFGTLTTTAAVGFGSTSKLQWELGANNLSAADKVDAGTINVTTGAKIDVVLNSPGSSTNFLHSFWRTLRTIPVISGSAMTGTFSLGTVSADAGGRPVATYGSFAVQNTATGANLVWTPIPGFPILDDPIITLTNPPGNTVSIPDTAHTLRVSATFTSGTNAILAWSQVSGPGAVVFANPAAADTHVSFPEQGTYVLRCTVTNEVGGTSQDFTVLVAPTSSITLREGVNDYSHQATFIRSDTTTWNSGARDQIIVGRNATPFRGLLSFDIPEIPTGLAVESASLDLWISETGSGNLLLNTLELYKLFPAFLEGIGDGITATNGAGTGADWVTRTGDAADPWNAPGCGSGTDYAATVLSTRAGFNPTTTAVGTRMNFATSPALVVAVSGAAGSVEPLGLLLKMATDTSGSGVFARFASNEHPTLAWRPQLTIRYSTYAAPAITPGTAPAAITGQFAPINGSVTDALSSQWSLVSGPGIAFFGNSTLPATTVMFTHPGTYVLRLSAANSFGETSRTLTITTTGTALTAAEIWRQQYFGTTANAGTAADSFDADGDGETNLIEFATGQNPEGGHTRHDPCREDRSRSRIHLRPQQGRLRRGLLVQHRIQRQPPPALDRRRPRQSCHRRRRPNRQIHHPRRSGRNSFRPPQSQFALSPTPGITD